jgi:hypothetical protein
MSNSTDWEIAILDTAPQGPHGGISRESNCADTEPADGSKTGTWPSSLLEILGL